MSDLVPRHEQGNVIEPAFKEGLILDAAYDMDQFSQAHAGRVSVVGRHIASLRELQYQAEDRLDILGGSVSQKTSDPRFSRFMDESSPMQGGPFYFGAYGEVSQLALPPTISGLARVLSRGDEDEPMAVSAIRGKNGCHQIAIIPRTLLKSAISYAHFRSEPAALFGLNGQHLLGATSWGSGILFGGFLEPKDLAGIKIDTEVVGRRDYKNNSKGFVQAKILGGQDHHQSCYGPGAARRDLEAILDNPLSAERICTEALFGVIEMLEGQTHEHMSGSAWDAYLTDLRDRFEAGKATFDRVVRRDTDAFQVEIDGFNLKSIALQMLVEDLGINGTNGRYSVRYERSSSSDLAVSLIPIERTSENAGIRLNVDKSGKNWKVDVIDSSPVPSRYELPEEYKPKAGAHENLLYMEIFSDLVAIADAAHWQLTQGFGRQKGEIG